MSKYFSFHNALAVSIFSLVCIFAFVFFGQSKNTITLKDDGFFPRTLTVRAGDTVTFKSKREKYFWPASDFHPAHTLYPAFDAKGPIAPSAEWQFTFVEPGVYKYHDHLAAYFFGIIRVLDENGTAIDSCTDRGGAFECWQNEVFFALAEKGVDAAYDTVQRLYETVPDFAASCHSIAHNIGLASYQFYRSNPDFIFSSKAIVCAAGFYHGFMEGYLGATGDIAGSASICDEIGDRLGAETPDARLQCYHGVGHGAVETTIADSGSFGSREVFIESAIALCEKASSGVEERYRCVSGIYNGIANFYINGAYGLSVEDENPLALCVLQPNEYKEACYGNMNSIALWAADNDFKKAGAWLMEIPEIEQKPKAVEYLAGLYAVNHVNDTSFSSVIMDCRSLPVAYRISCFSGFTQGLLEHGSPSIEYKQALVFCREPELTDSERSACLSEVLGNADKWYSYERAKSVCEGALPAESSFCF